MDRTVLARDRAWASQRAPLLAHVRRPRTPPPTGPRAPRKAPVTAEGSHFHGSGPGADPAGRNVSCPLRSSCLQARNAARSPRGRDPWRAGVMAQGWDAEPAPRASRGPSDLEPLAASCTEVLRAGALPTYRARVVALAPQSSGGRPCRHSWDPVRPKRPQARDEHAQRGGMADTRKGEGTRGGGRGGWTEAPGGAGASEGAVPGAQMQGPSFKGRGRRLRPMSTESRVGALLFSGVPTGWPWGSGELAKTPEDSSFKFCLVAQKPLFMNSRGDTGGAPRHGGVWGPPEPCPPLLARGRQTQQPAPLAATHCPG